MIKNIKFSLFILLALSVVSACETIPIAPTPDEISVRLKWLHGVQFAGLYIAEQQGFFAEENLSVSLLEGGLDFDELELVSTGQDDFGIIGGQSIVDGRHDGMPVKAIATIFQINPAVYFALTESGIEKPEDFIGRRVMVFQNDLKLEIMLNNVGVSLDQIIAVPPSTDLSTFYQGEEEVWLGYITNQVVRARLDGNEINVIFPEDYGIYEYGDSIITTDEMIRQNPDLIERFLRAAMRGWSYAIEHPAESAAATTRYSDTEDDAFLLASMESQIPLVHNGEAPIGWMEAGAWQALCEILQKQQDCPNDFNVEEAYTLQFLQAVYGNDK